MRDMVRNGSNHGPQRGSECHFQGSGFKIYEVEDVS